MADDSTRYPYEVKAGWFKMSLTRRGWKVPCQIVHLDNLWQAIINGEPKQPHANPMLAEGVEQICLWGRPIPKFEHDYLLALAGTAPADHPSRHPDRPIDRMQMAPVAVPKRRR